MAVRIRRANLDSDRIALIELSRRYLTSTSDSKRFEWLYRRCPHGEAISWVACDSATEEVVAAAAAFPRRVYSNGEEKLGLVLGDFCVNEKYRSLGPSLQLQRACVGMVSDAGFDFFYDFPSDAMMAIYRRLGIPQTGAMIRWTRPLRMEAKLERALRFKALSKSVAYLANSVLARRGWRGAKDACEVELHLGPCGQEFDQLDKQLQSSAGVQTARTAGYLNWRYFEHPNKAHEILTARRQGALIGYIVYTKDAEDANIVDLGAIEESAVIARLLSAAVDRLGSLGAAAVNLNAGDSHPWSDVFERSGFWKRESSPSVVYSSASSTISASDFQQNWHVMRGERES